MRLILRPFQCILRQDPVAIFTVVFSGSPDRPIDRGCLRDRPGTDLMCDYEITLASDVDFTSFSESLSISNSCFGP